MGYTRDAAKGFGWYGLLRGFTRLLAMVKFALIARLLTPGDFGRFGMITLVIVFFETFTETGINIVLVRKEKAEAYINTAYIISIVRGLLIALLMLLMAKPVAWFFKQEDIFVLLLATAMVPFIKGFINPSIIFFQKRLEFHKESLLRASMTVVDVVISLLLVWLTRSLWGLLAGLVVSALAEVIISWIVCTPRPKLRFEWSQAKDILHFSKWFNALVISNYFSSQLDSILIGRFLGAQVLGFYQAGYKLAHAPIMEMGDIVAQTTFPIYSKLQHDINRLQRAYARISGLSAGITAIPVLVLMIFAVPLVRIIFGEQWGMTATVVPLLAITAWVRAIIAPASAVFLSLNQPKYLTFASASRIGVLGLVALWLMPSMGIVGASIGVFLSNVCALPIIWYGMRKISKNAAPLPVS